MKTRAPTHATATLSAVALVSLFALIPDLARAGRPGGDPDEDRGVEMYLAIDSIPSDNETPEHKGQTQVLAWSWGASNSGAGRRDCASPSTEGEEARAAGVTMQDISMTKFQDATTAQLLGALVQGKVIKKVVLTVVKPKAKDKPLMRITFENVMISSVSMGGSGGEDRFTENLSFSFEKMRFENARVTAKVTGREVGKLFPPFVYDRAALAKLKHAAKGDAKAKP